jgi:5-bromo-4-chloroindolyl phosphate hydrolysis protein
MWKSEAKKKNQKTFFHSKAIADLTEAYFKRKEHTTKKQLHEWDSRQKSHKKRRDNLESCP